MHLAQESGFRKFCGAPPFSGRLPGARQHLCTVSVCLFCAGGPPSAEKDLLGIDGWRTTKP